MDIFQTLFNPGVLFFILGLFSVFIKSNLQLPESIVKFISYYLMIAIGFKGGVSLYTTPLTFDAAFAVGFVLLMSALVPVYTYYVLPKSINHWDAAAIGGTYGSNSTLTYITAAAFLTSIDVTYGAFMTIALVVMETPAIILSLFIANRSEATKVFSAFTDGTVILLLGSMLVGFLTVAMGTSENVLTQFIAGDMFTGMLIFFLLYMGTLVGQKIRDIDHFPASLYVFAVLAPIFNGTFALVSSYLVGLDAGSTLLLTILCASSSYIVAPAVLKDALPKADPGKYLSMSLGITFPINIVLGIPIYWQIIEWLW